MKLMVHWKVHEDKWLDVMKKWSSMTPAERADVGQGVKLIGRWHATSQKSGVAIFDVTDQATFELYAGQWAPVMALTVAPVLDDEESAAVGKQLIAGR